MNRRTLRRLASQLTPTGWSIVAVFFLATILAAVRITAGGR